ncbi:hypothetical protein GQ55_1G421300 [Panicum hallii var. hallii]|uniref:Uncharacterized protein n=1 Tax=Panicum hallii var. hallii TaxID=1504633 RepID=A0A2T7FD79_9POAL|nr:hypothetical protein GQ55_1G421300 [Panicum hallii var. hallii]PUZ78037.1 hypothetical protein GQ55_1G421300 [Panicum hallii var. hallii]
MASLEWPRRRRRRAPRPPRHRQRACFHPSLPLLFSEYSTLSPLPELSLKSEPLPDPPQRPRAANTFFWWCSSSAADGELRAWDTASHRTTSSGSRGDGRGVLGGCWRQIQGIRKLLCHGMNVLIHSF